MNFNKSCKQKYLLFKRRFTYEKAYFIYFFKWKISLFPLFFALFVTFKKINIQNFNNTFFEVKFMEIFKMYNLHFLKEIFLLIKYYCFFNEIFSTEFYKQNIVLRMGEICTFVKKK